MAALLPLQALKVIRAAMSVEGEARSTEWRGVVRYESAEEFNIPVPAYVAGLLVRTADIPKREGSGGWASLLALRDAP